MGKGSRDSSAVSAMRARTYAGLPPDVHVLAYNNPLAYDGAEEGEWVLDIPDASREVLSPVGESNGWVRYRFEKLYTTGSFGGRKHIGFRAWEEPGSAGTVIGVPASPTKPPTTPTTTSPTKGAAVAASAAPLVALKRKDGNGYTFTAAEGTGPEATRAHCATFSWNLLRTEFRLQGRWCECCEPGSTPFTATGVCKGGGRGGAGALCRMELGAFSYERNWTGDKPRKLHVAMPPMDRQRPSHAHVMCPMQGHPPLLDSLKQGQVRLQHLLHLQTRESAWNPATGKHEMRFSPEVKLPSVHNFQLVDHNANDHVLLKLGKTAPGTYLLEFRYPLSPVQALACALSSFEANSLCT